MYEFLNQRGLKTAYVRNILVTGKTLDKVRDDYWATEWIDRAFYWDSSPEGPDVWRAADKAWRTLAWDTPASDIPFGFPTRDQLAMALLEAEALAEDRGP